VLHREAALHSFGLLAIVRPHLFRLCIALVVFTLGSVVQLVSPWLAGQFSDALLVGKNTLSIGTGTLLVGIGLFFVIQNFLRFYGDYITGTTGEFVTAALRMKVYEHLLALPLQYHKEEKRGETLSFITNDVSVISQFVTTTLVGIVPTLITLTGALIIVVSIAPAMLYLGVLLVPAYLFLRFLRRRIHPMSRQLMDLYSENYGQAYDHLANLPMIKSFGAIPAKVDEYGASNRRIIDVSRRLTVLQSMISPMVQTVSVIGLLIVLWYGSGLYRQEDGTPGQIVSLVLYGMLVVRPLSSLAGVYGEIVSVQGAAERLRELMALSVETDTGDVVIDGVDQGIEFRSVDFSYEGREPVFRNLNLHIEAGKVTAITGHNGVGKTTLVKLLAGLLLPDTGRIFIDGIDIDAIKRASLRMQIATVHQESYVMHASILDNIRVGKPSASLADVRGAAEIAQASDFVAKLPNQFDTVLGDDGGLISGGQQQRVVLARAILADRPVLILDEATSWFDLPTESEFVESLRPYIAEKTVIIITHREAMLALADRVVNLDDLDVGAVEA
jgi:ATP-binding cassette, subfamily B, bacterial